MGSDSRAHEINEVAAAEFERAQADFEAKRFDHAALGFRGAALTLKTGGDLPEADELERNRRIAYANMVLSWLNIDATDNTGKARVELEALAARDPALAEALRDIASRLPRPPRCAALSTSARVCH